MGRLIDRLATEAGDTVTHRVDTASRKKLTAADLDGTEVVIDFSHPTAAVANIRFAVAANIPIVVGTTGWLDRLEEVSTEVMQNGGSLFWAANFSVGVHLFFASARELAARFADHDEYACTIEETHHVTKVDAPSGTALRLQQVVAEVWGSEPPITAYREPDVPGTHLLRFSSRIDSVTLTHEARSREGFARGAIRAARWLVGRKGVYTMNDLL